MASKFHHSIKVPTLYKSAASIARKVKEEGHSLKDLLYNSRRSVFQNTKALYSIILRTLKNYETLEILFKKSEILKKEKRLDPWLARILISEMLWKGKKLHGNSKPVATVSNYEKQFQKILNAVPKQEEEAAERRIFVRVNTLQKTITEVKDEFILEGWNLVSTPQKYEDFVQEVMTLEEGSFIQDWHIPEILIFPPKSYIHEHNLNINGSIVIQDKASCFVAHALAPPPGSIVLDMCAAPGLKTAHCAALMRNEGKIYAVEMNKKRFGVLNKLVDKLGCSCVETIHEDALKLDSNDLDCVKYIMVDVPCTGSGIVSRYDYSSKLNKQERVDSLHKLQCSLLKRAMKNFPSVTKIIYSTCSLHEEENEAVIEDVLASKASSEFKLVECKALKGKNISCGIEKYSFSKKCYRFEPEKHMTNGFFIAMFKRSKKNLDKECDEEKQALLNESDELPLTVEDVHSSVNKENNCGMLHIDVMETRNGVLTETNESYTASLVLNVKKQTKKKKKKRKLLNESDELSLTVEDMGLSIQSEDANKNHVKRKKKKKTCK